MKNIHVLPTDKEPVKGDLLLRHIWKDTSNECISWWRYDDTITIDGVVQYTTLNGSFRDITSSFKVQNIYITNDEEIKEGDWYIFPLYKKGFSIKRYNSVEHFSKEPCISLANLKAKKIILTTDQDLIKYGVQAIDDEFLEWFVKNPSRESVEVEKMFNVVQFTSREYIYKIILPKEEPKQETLEEFIERTIDESFEIQLASSKIEKYMKLAAKWQQERMYSVIDEYVNDVMGGCNLRFYEWFEQFKNK